MIRNKIAPWEKDRTGPAGPREIELILEVSSIFYFNIYRNYPIP